MSFLQPWWALLALLAVPLVLLHGRRASTRLVPALTIWRLVGAAATPARRRAWRPRVTGSLLLQLAALLALMLALMGPRPAAGRVDHHVFVVDRTASMAAAGDDGSRLELALQAARAELGALDVRARGGPLVSLVTVGSQVRIEAALHASPRRALAALEGSAATRAPDAASWRRVAEVVLGLGESDEATRVTVLTDGAGAASARTALGDGPWRLDVRAFGAAAGSRGLAMVRTVPIEPAEGRWRIEGQIVSHPPQDEPVTIEVRFARADVEGSLPWDEVRVVPDAPITAFSFETELPSAGVLTLSLPDDALPADDVARLVLRDEPIPLRVLLWGPLPDALRDAVAALEGAQVTNLGAAEPLPSEVAFDLAIVSSGIDAEPAALPEGPALARTVVWTGGIGPMGRYVPRETPVEEPVPGPRAAAWSPLLDVPEGALERTYRIPRLTGAQVLLAVGDDPLLQVRTDSTRTDVVAAWDLGSTPWVRELGFAAFIADLAESAVPRHGRWSGTRCIAGRGCGGLDVRSGDLGVRMGTDGPWVLDTEAGPESDLQLAGVGGDAMRSPFAWSRLDRALSLLAALLLAIDGLRIWWRGRSVEATSPPRERLVARGARIGAVLALVLVAALVPFPTFGPPPRPVLVVDAWTRVRDAAAPDDAPTGLRATARDANHVVLAERTGRVVPAEPSAWRADGGASDARGAHLPTVLDMAAGLVREPGGTIVLAGVGFDHGAPVGDLAASLEARDIAVDILPAASPDATEAWIDDLSLPSRARADERVRVRVSVAGPARAEHAVRILVDDVVVGTLATEGPVGSLSFDVGEEGRRSIRAELTPGAAGIEANDTRTALLEVLPPARLAVLTAAGEDRGFVRADAEDPAIARRFRSEGFEVEAWRPRDVPVDAEEFLDVDVVVLSDVPAIDLTAQQQQALERWVRDYGGGLLIAGAEEAYGPGGYLRTPLETLSPLSGRVPGEQPKAAVAFVIDRSGSMQQSAGGTTRLAVAKEATLAAVDLLHPASEVAIVVFDDLATTLVPMGPPENLRQALAPVAPGGGTNLYPAIEAAFAELQGADAEAKHMIVLTDGLSKTAPFDMLVPRVAGAGITISTVAVGAAPDVTLLESIARSAGGVFHQSADVRALPSILAQEAMLLSGDPLREGEVTPRLASLEAAFLEDLTEPFPAMGGYVRTTPQPEADLHATTPDGDPILASWRHGVGRVVALATPLAGTWADSWTSSRFATQLLHGAIRWLDPPFVAPGLTLEARQEGDALRLDAIVVDEAGRGAEGIRVTAEVTAPEDGAPVATTLDELGGGRYTARIPAYEPGRYAVRVVASGAGDEPIAVDTLVHVSYPAALAPGPDRSVGPSELARATGGRVVLDAEPRPRNPVWRLGTTDAAAPWTLLGVAFAAAGLAVEAGLGRSTLARRRGEA